MRARYGGVDASEAKRRNAPQDNNAKLKKLLAESMLQVVMLRELLGQKF